MRARIFVGFLSFTIFLAGTVWAQEKKEAASAEALSPQIKASIQFLTAWGHEKWDDLAQVVAGKVSVSVGGKEYAVDPEGKKVEAKPALPFKGLSTVREGGKVKAVTVNEITVKAGSDEKTGKATLALEEKEGNFKVTKVTAE